jgi:hypothetical protein
MQSPGTKSKRSRKIAEESAADLSQIPVAAEETANIRRKTSTPKAAAESTPAAKQHRGAAKKAPAAVAASPFPAAKPIGHADIATLAYSYWENRGYQGGSPEEDWFRAEKQLLSQR